MDPCSGSSALCLSALSNVGAPGFLVCTPLRTDPSGASGAEREDGGVGSEVFNFFGAGRLYDAEAAALRRLCFAPKAACMNFPASQWLRSDGYAAAASVNHGWSRRAFRSVILSVHTSSSRTALILPRSGGCGPRTTFFFRLGGSSTSAPDGGTRRGPPRRRCSRRRLWAWRPRTRSDTSIRDGDGILTALAAPTTRRGWSCEACPREATAAQQAKGSQGGRLWPPPLLSVLPAKCPRGPSLCPPV